MNPVPSNDITTVAVDGFGQLTIAITFGEVPVGKRILGSKFTVNREDSVRLAKLILAAECVAVTPKLCPKGHPTGASNPCGTGICVLDVSDEIRRDR